MSEHLKAARNQINRAWSTRRIPNQWESMIETALENVIHHLEEQAQQRESTSPASFAVTDGRVLMHCPSCGAKAEVTPLQSVEPETTGFSRLTGTGMDSGSAATSAPYSIPKSTSE